MRERVRLEIVKRISQETAKGKGVTVKKKEENEERKIEKQKT